MLYGEQIPVGDGVSTALASGDFETYCEAGYTFEPHAQRWRATQKGKPGLKSVGAWAYSVHPSAEVLTFVYDLKDGRGRYMWHPGLSNPVDLFEHLARGGLFEAVNSFFEYCVWTNICVPKYGWPPLPLAQVRDVAAKAAAWSLPRKLESLCDLLNTPVKKSKTGTAEMRILSKPRNATQKDKRLRYTREEDPERFTILDDYCFTDVETEDMCSARLPDLSAHETDIFLADQSINARGAQCDVETVRACMSIVEQARAKYNAELRRITGGSVGTSDELDKMKAFLARRGVEAFELTKDSIPKLLKQNLPADVRRVLEIRSAMGSLSVTKTFAMHYTATPAGRIHGMYTYCGAARTRRWSGSGAQPQNLPNAGPEVVRCSHCNGVYWSGLSYCPACMGPSRTPCDWGIEAAEACIPALRTKSLATVEALWGDALKAIAGCLRSFFIAGPGCELICSDFVAIEAVITAVLAGEEWVLEVFRTHGKIYEMTASRITGIPFEEFQRYKEAERRNHPQRKLGKTGSLASQYGGGLEAWHNFGADEFLSDPEIHTHIKAWRKANPAIVALWAGLEEAAIAAVQHPGQAFRYRLMTYQVYHDVLYALLPSGRTIPYHSPRVTEVIRFKRTQPQLTYLKAYGAKFIRVDTFGGKLTGNAAQSTARDVHADTIVRLERLGYPIVIHTHDEPCAEVLLGHGSIEEFETEMVNLPVWCRDWPIKASGGWRGQRYRK